MSHFFTLVIADSQEKVGELLAPYNENTEVPEYDRPCYCIGKVRERKATEILNAEMGTWKDIQERFNEVHKGEAFDIKDAAYRAEVYDTRHIRELEILATIPGESDPDPDCDECHGKGTNRSTYNPKSQWDWWVVGGRWLKMEPTGYASVNSFLTDDRIPFAIVTPDGDWHQKGEMLYWGVVADEKDNWPEEARAILNQYADRRGYVCDLHI